MNDDDLFRAQVESAAAFMTFTYTAEPEEIRKYLEGIDTFEQMQMILVGIQSLLGYSLNRIAKMDGTFTHDVGANALNKLREIMLEFYQYDADVRE